jgi:two-component system OmpR family sensor kinase
VSVPRHWKHRRHHWDPATHRSWYLRWRLQRRIFLTLASAILVTSLTVFFLLRTFGYAHQPPSSHAGLAIFVAILFLWGFSRFMARRIAGPMQEIERVAREIGAGNMHARLDLHDRRMRMGELPILGHVMNEMADRIEKQLSDQRALLATVSHEIRTPLARMRLLVEFAREGATDKAQGSLEELDKEIVGVDALVSELLAASRIDFGALRRTTLVAKDVVLGALERSKVEPSALDDRTEDGTFMGDATLVARAVGNLIENAKRHGGGTLRVRILERGPRIAFEVEDDGPGFSPGEEDQVFLPFYRGKNGKESGASVGLGLALVKRIAEAHGGRAYAQNREGGGARVGIELSRGARDGEGAT